VSSIPCELPVTEIYAKVGIYMAFPLTQAELNEYRRSAQQRRQREQQQQAQLRERAWQVAHQAAAHLRTRFGVRQVILFGSLARGDLFHAHSDVDLAVAGLDDRRYYRAVGQLQSLDPAIPVDLVRLEDAPDTLRKTIAQEGKELP
jgi:uncharacterized protein